MRSLIQHLRHAAQWQPLPGREQVENNAGGYVFEVDRWTRLERFLVLGSEGGTYYVEERELTLESAHCVFECLAKDAPRTVEAIAAISRAGCAPSNRPALFALAIAFCEETAVPSARARFSDVVRTGSHLFEFLAAVRALRGFGRALRGAVANWYLEKPVDRLAYQLVKYRRRAGWTHRDALRLCHAKDEERNALLAWAVGKEAGELPEIVRGFSLAQSATVAALPELVRAYRLTHEMVPSHALKDADVLRALAESMPIAALLRYLGRLSKAGLLRGNDPLVDRICGRLDSAEEICGARLHPMAILVALRTYASGRGMAGQLSWNVNGRVADALNRAFLLAFDNVATTGARLLVAVDVSGSMAFNHCSGAQSLTCAEGAAALALVTARTEPGTILKAFSGHLVDLPISPMQRLDDAMRAADRISYGPTDCSLPMRWALRERVPVDAFVILTDNETWYGHEHPCDALRSYRQALGIDARLVVVAMTGNEFSIADPTDPRSLDVVGFDTATPRVLADFVGGGAVATPD